MSLMPSVLPILTSVPFFLGSFLVHISDRVIASGYDQEVDPVHLALRSEMWVSTNVGVGLVLRVDGACEDEYDHSFS